MDIAASSVPRLAGVPERAWQLATDMGLPACRELKQKA
jgi:hypothetical protein